MLDNFVIRTGMSHQGTTHRNAFHLKIAPSFVLGYYWRSNIFKLVVAKEGDEVKGDCSDVVMIGHRAYTGSDLLLQILNTVFGYMSKSATRVTNTQLFFKANFII